MTALLMDEALRECGLPDDIFQVLVGRGPIGLTLIDQVDMVMFTGSTATGKTVMERAAKTLTPVSLELGGKDPMIVFEDANIERAAAGGVWGDSQRRPNLHLGRARVRRGADLRTVRGDGWPSACGRCDRACPATSGRSMSGSFTNPPQIEIVQAHVADAVAKGARVLAGGHRLES